jgi:hypothetical protein
MNIGRCNGNSLRYIGRKSLTRLSSGALFVNEVLQNGYLGEDGANPFAKFRQPIKKYLRHLLWDSKEILIFTSPSLNTYIFTKNEFIKNSCPMSRIITFVFF